MMAISPTVRNALSVIAVIGIVGIFLILHTSSNKTTITQITYTDFSTVQETAATANPSMTSDFVSQSATTSSNDVQTTSKKRVTITTSSVPLDSTEFSSTTASFETTAEPFRNGSYADLKSKLDNVRDNEKVDPARQRITHWSLDYQENAKDMGTMLEKRRSKVYSTCDKYRKDILASYTNSRRRLNALYDKQPRIITDYDDGLSFCFVAKTGSTFWKSVFIYLKTGQIEFGLKFVLELPAKYRKSITTWSQDKVANKFPSFMAVRNPWKRLVSLYQQKIEAYLASDGSPLSDTRKLTPFTYIRRVCHREAEDMTTFEDLLDCVLWSWDRRKTNVHWMPALESCDVCDQKFDYIIRVENMMEEGAYVMEQVGISDAAEVLSTVREGTIRDVEHHKHKSTAEYYKDIPQRTIDSLRDMYRYELLLFGYPDTPFTD